MRKYADAPVLGKGVKIYERTAFDVFELYKYMEGQKDKNFTSEIMAMAAMISDAARPNLKWKPWLRKRLSVRGLINSLSPSQLGELVSQINELEGNKKKVTGEESQSVVNPPEA
jgi:hypothetical protein